MLNIKFVVLGKLLTTEIGNPTNVVYVVHAVMVCWI